MSGLKGSLRQCRLKPAVRRVVMSESMGTGVTGVPHGELGGPEGGRAIASPTGGPPNSPTPPAGGDWAVPEGDLDGHAMASGAETRVDHSPVPPEDEAD